MARHSRSVAVALGNSHSLMFAALAVLSVLPAARVEAQRTMSVYVMNVDGAQVRKLVDVDGYANQEVPRWSHDGTRIAFHASRPGSGNTDVFLVNADGSGLVKLGAGRYPDWSPDDKQIALEHDGEVFVENADGKARDRVAAGSCPRWSPDGSRLLVSENLTLRVIDMVSGEERQLLEPTANVIPPACWSPDGRTIAISVRPLENTKRQLLLVNSQGAEKGLRARIDSTAGMSGGMTFSPDGKRLAYSGGYLLMILDVEGDKKPRIIPDQKGYNFEPDWSPDGKRLAFTSNRQ